MMLRIVVFVLAVQCSLVFAANKPNILMFVIDDLGWNDTSYRGSDIPTPANARQRPPSTSLLKKGSVYSNITFNECVHPQDQP